MINRGLAKRTAARGAIIFFFIMAFEVMVMISPFAFFFYSVFNPVFDFLNRFAATKWLTSFFLPHMILPPTLTLKTIRILGSVSFIAGFLTFIVCALQVYLGKIFGWGIAHKGFYKYVRHPQYLGLGIWSIGMVILWPRFVVLATLSLMFVLYYILARDEERRMITQYGESYRQYIKSTGMFLPACIERPFSIINRWVPVVSLRYMAVSMATITVVIGAGFICRELTLRSLRFESRDNLTLVSILPEDNKLSANILDKLSKNHGRKDFLKNEKDYLGYVMPANYVMQGLIADTGIECELYKRRKTFALMAHWVLHPFEHLRNTPLAGMAKDCPIQKGIEKKKSLPPCCRAKCPSKRIIIVEVQHDYGEHVSGRKLFSFNSSRIPVCFVDLDTQTGEMAEMKQVVGKATAWKDIPTPFI